MTKRQLYIDEIEHDLIETALAFWEFRLDKDNSVEPCGQAHWYAKHFTKRRITALKKRLANLKEKV